MKELVETLASEFKDKEYAHSYLEEFSNMEIAAQIKVLREQRDLTQDMLAVLSCMKQERISKLEDVNYDAWTIKTLRKLARAFDVDIKVSFEEISSRILDIDRLSKESLERKSRVDDLESFTKNGFSYENDSPMWGQAVLTPAQGTTKFHSVPANDSWCSVSETLTSLCSNR